LVLLALYPAFQTKPCPIGRLRQCVFLALWKRTAIILTCLTDWLHVLVVFIPNKKSPTARKTDWACAGFNFAALNVTLTWLGLAPIARRNATYSLTGFKLALIVRRSTKATGATQLSELTARTF
jgi:hypothetical protein